jgi:hypothetical protein
VAGSLELTREKVSKLFYFVATAGERSNCLASREHVPAIATPATGMNLSLAFGAAFFPRSRFHLFRECFFFLLQAQLCAPRLVGLLHGTLWMNAVARIGRDSANGAELTNLWRKDGDGLEALHVERRTLVSVCRRPPCMAANVEPGACGPCRLDF